MKGREGKWKCEGKGSGREVEVCMCALFFHTFVEFGKVSSP